MILMLKAKEVKRSFICNNNAYINILLSFLFLLAFRLFQIIREGFRFSKNSLLKGLKSNNKVFGMLGIPFWFNEN